MRRLRRPRMKVLYLLLPRLFIESSAISKITFHLYPHSQVNCLLTSGLALHPCGIIHFSLLNYTHDVAKVLHRLNPSTI